jgi:sugar porter (SP) family MFS transporter
MSGVLANDSYKRMAGFPGASAQGGIVAAMPGGSLVGALIVGWLADKVGRKNTVIISGWIWVIGSILQCASVVCVSTTCKPHQLTQLQNRAMLVVGRVISGISVGLSSAVVPLYQSEITAPHIRGRMVSLQQWSITWGILLQYFVQFGCSYIDGVASFRIPWGLQMIPAIILAVGMTWFPESPRWLIDHGRDEEALQILADVHGKGDPKNELVQLEFAEIREQVHLEKTQGAKSYLDLLPSNIFRRVSLGMSLQMWSQLTGMNIMMYYIIYVFRAAGVVGTRANLIASSVQYVLNVAMTVPAIIYIDKWGRRPLLLGGLAFMGFWLFLVGGLQGTYGDWQILEDGERVWMIQGHKNITRFIIACSYLFVCSFAVTMGPVSWTYPAEIFPMRVRAKAVSLSTAANWTFNCALAFGVPPGFASIAWRTYLIFGTFNFAAWIHVFFMFPETKGRTLEEVEEIFGQGHVFSAWKVKDGRSRDTSRAHAYFQIKSDVGKKTLSQVLQSKVENQENGSIKSDSPKEDSEWSLLVATHTLLLTTPLYSQKNK